MPERDPNMVTMLLASAKATDWKCRWDAYCEGNVRFSLYIPQWRIPEPWPPEILVNLEPIISPTDGLAAISRSTARQDPTTRDQPILVVVGRKQDKMNSVRYEPLGDKDEWQLGEPYVPYSLLPKEIPDFLRITVRWVA